MKPVKSAVPILASVILLSGCQVVSVRHHPEPSVYVVRDRVVHHQVVHQPHVQTVHQQVIVQQQNPSPAQQNVAKHPSRPLAATADREDKTHPPGRPGRPQHKRSYDSGQRTNPPGQHVRDKPASVPEKTHHRQTGTDAVEISPTPLRPDHRMKQANTPATPYPRARSVASDARIWNDDKRTRSP